MSIRGAQRCRVAEPTILYVDSAGWVEEVDEGGVGRDADAFAGLRRDALAEEAGDLLAAVTGNDLRLGPGRLDHDDLRRETVRVDRQMLRPDPADQRPAVGGGRRIGDRQHE